MATVLDVFASNTSATNRVKNEIHVLTRLRERWPARFTRIDGATHLANAEAELQQLESEFTAMLDVLDRSKHNAVR